MQFSLIRGVVWVSIGYLALVDTTRAAVLTGRVVDSSGRPVAGAEVRIWQKLPDPKQGAADKQVMFDDREALLTDAEGRFATPNLLVGEAFARVVVEARGMLAGRSGWIEIGKDAERAAPDIALRRLRAVVGQVLDRQNQPVADATVFNSGDGHERTEAKTGRSGKFFLDGVPQGEAFLFAEKPGYRFTGVLLPAGGGETMLRLTAVDEPDAALTTLPPLLSAEEETALAHEVLDPWLDETLKSGVLMRGLCAIGGLQRLDPLAALKRFDALPIKRLPQRAISRHGLIEMAIASGQLSAAEAREFIESGDDPFMKAYEYLAAARRLGPGQHLEQVAWLDAALKDARLVADAAQRTQSLAAVAEAFAGTNEHERAKQILAEAETSAALLAAQAPGSENAIGKLALAWASSDPVRAIEWLEKVKDIFAYQRDGAQLALNLLPDRPEEAVAVWRRTAERAEAAQGRPTYRLRHDDIVEMCYRLAKVDLSRAKEITDAAETPALRIRGTGAIALALSETQPVQARELLRALVRDDLTRIAAEEHPSSGSSSPSITAAWLMPIAERVDPDLCGELLWRSLAMRSPRPRRNEFTFKLETADATLARMLARYDRDVAWTLLKPLFSHAAQVTEAAATEVKAQHTLPVAQAATQWARELITAAVYVDPHRARKLLVAIPSGGLFNAQDGARQAFVWAVVRDGAERWSADFWQPRSESNQKKPDGPE